MHHHRAPLLRAKRPLRLAHHAIEVCLLQTLPLELADHLREAAAGATWVPCVTGATAVAGVTSATGVTCATCAACTRRTPAATAAQCVKRPFRLSVAAYLRHRVTAVTVVTAVTAVTTVMAVTAVAAHLRHRVGVPRVEGINLAILGRELIACRLLRHLGRFETKESRLVGLHLRVQRLAPVRHLQRPRP